MNNVSDAEREKGSFLVAGALFLVVFLMIGGVAVDLSRYFMLSDKLQSVANGAALAGGKAFHQFRNKPNESAVYNAVLNYIEEKQGGEYRDLYPVKHDGDVEGIFIRNMHDDGSGCDPGFSINNGELTFSSNTTARTEVLGSAVTTSSGYRNFPITAQINATDTQGNTTSYEPWGSYNDPNGANLNNDNDQEQFMLSNQSESTTITAQARLYYPDNPGSSGGPYSLHEEKQSTGNDIKVLEDGDDVPGISGGFGQTSVAEYISDYVNPVTGKVSLQENQAIFLFEMTHSANAPRADFQDLVLLANMAPGQAGSSSSSSVIPVGSSTDWGSKECMQDNPAYRVGVITYEDFEPFFLPSDVFGDDPRTMSKTAIAEITPTTQAKTESFDPDCGVYANQSMVINGNNLTAGQTNFCGNADVLAGGSNNGTMGDLYHYGAISAPGGGYGQVKKLNRKIDMPEFTQTSGSTYDVLFNSANVNSWPSCSNKGKKGKKSGTTKTVLTQTGQNVVWSNGGNVCVTYDGVGTYTISGNNKGAIQHQDGSAVSMFSTANFSFTGNGLDVNGGLYSQGDITVDGNNHTFSGDPSVMGGLALWAEDKIDILMNNISMDGILGTTNGDITLGSKGGGTGPDFEGVVVSGGGFTFPSNSNNAQIDHDTTKYQDGYLNKGDWEIEPQQMEVAAPNFANIKVRLIES